MIVRLTPEYKFVCDRCGKEQFATEGESPFETHLVEFCERRPPFSAKSKKGEICTACATEFWELANNFFDEVNKERSEE
jgi:hypothetical protein